MPKKKLPNNKLKVSVSTINYSLSNFLKHKHHSDLSSITKVEIFIDFIGVSGKRMSLSHQAFDWRSESDLPGFVVYYIYSSVQDSSSQDIILTL